MGRHRHDVGRQLNGMMPTLFAENPGAAEVAFHGDPVNARKDVDRLIVNPSSGDDWTFVNSITEDKRTFVNPSSGDK